MPGGRGLQALTVIFHTLNVVHVLWQSEYDSCMLRATYLLNVVTSAYVNEYIVDILQPARHIQL